MVQSVFIPLAIWQLAVAIFSAILLLYALKRYIVKKTQATRYLVAAFLFYTIALWSIFVGSYLARILELPVGSFSPAENPAWGWALSQALLQDYQIAYFFVSFGTLCIYLFSKEIFHPGESLKGVSRILAIIVPIVITIYGSFKRYLPIPDLGELTTYIFGIDIPVLLYILAVMIPLLKGSTGILKRINKNEPHYVNILYLGIMSIGFIAAVGALVVETFIGNIPNFASYLGWGLTVFTLATAYKGFFAIKK